MSWARLDDRFHGNPKVMRAWHSQPAAVGLYVMCLTYCAQHETDGHIDEGFVLMLCPVKRDRERLVGVLIDGGLWQHADGGWSVPDYLQFNPSRADLEAKRKRERERGRRARAQQTADTLPADTRHVASNVTAGTRQPAGSRPGPTRRGSATANEGTPLRGSGMSDVGVIRAQGPSASNEVPL